MLRVVGMSIGLLGVVAGYGIGQGVLVGGRSPAPGKIEARLKGPTVQTDPNRPALAALHAGVLETRGVVQGIEALLRVMSREIEDRKMGIAAVRSRLSSVERQYPGGAPPEVLLAHSRDASRLNLLVREYDLKVQRYKKLWTEYATHRDRLQRQIEEVTLTARALGIPGEGLTDVLVAPASIGTPQS